MSLIRTFIAAAFLFVPLTASSEDDTHVELTHWWNSSGEKAALDKIREGVEKRGAKFQASALQDYDVLRARIAERISEGYPPAMTQWLGGSDILELLEIDAIQPAPSHWNNSALEDILFPEVIEEISQLGLIAGIPVGIHIQNMAFFNAKIYRQLSLELPDNWQTFLTQAEIIKQAGYTPLAVSDEPWQLRFLFNDILMGELGIENFLAFYNEKQSIKSWKAELENALTLFLKLRDYVDEGHKDRLWNEATAQLINGTAALQIMGDFAKGELLYAGKVAGEDFLCALAPGAGDTMIYALDTFVMLKVRHPTLKKGQDLLFETVLDPKVQADFNKLKGGIPVRNDVDISQLDSCAKEQYQAWTDPQQNNARLPDTMSRLRLTFVQNLLQKAWRENLSPQQANAELIAVISEALDN